MRLIRGINHIAVLTDDLDRFVEFYTTVFDLAVAFTETTPAFRHAIIRTGVDSWLHPAEVFGNDHGTAIPTMFERGHLDHLALTTDSVAAFDVLRARLIERGATDGTIEDLGAFHSLWFTDPDGMRGEVTHIVDPHLSMIHAPKPRPTNHCRRTSSGNRWCRAVGHREQRSGWNLEPGCAALTVCSASW